MVKITTLVFIFLILKAIFTGDVFSQAWEEWDQNGPINAGITPSEVSVSPGEIIDFKVSAIDKDHFIKFKVAGPKALREVEREGFDEDDFREPKWQKDGGFFLAWGKWSVQYMAPKEPGVYNIIVTIEDIGKLPRLAEGGRKDLPVKVSAKVVVKNK